MKKIVLAVGMAVVLAGCSTPYTGGMGLMGGVDAEPITADIYRIKARGNGYTSGSRVQDFVLLKAAETTLAAGRTHFILGGSQDTTRFGSFSTPGTMQATRVGNTVYGSYDPGMTVNFVKPGQDTYVQTLSVPKGQQPPPGAFDAAEISRVIGPRIRQ
jgi:hypothetical protein